MAVVSRGQPPLSEHTHHPCGHKAWSARRQGDYWKAEGETTCTHHIPTGIADAERDWGSEVPWMFSTHTKGLENRIWWGNSCCATATESPKEEENMHPLVRENRNNCCAHALSIDGRMPTIYIYDASKSSWLIRIEPFSVLYMYRYRFIMWGLDWPPHTCKCTQHYTSSIIFASIFPLLANIVWCTE